MPQDVEADGVLLGGIIRVVTAVETEIAERGKFGFDLGPPMSIIVNLIRRPQ